MTWGHAFFFLAGFIVGLATWVLWKALRFAADLKAARHAVESYVYPECGLADERAKAAIDACKKRMRWTKNPNPEWLAPLVDEVPRLVREIAANYHPEHAEPLLAPGLSQFTRAIHLAAMDLADFLQTRAVGRLVDVSASTALKTWEMTHKIVKHDTVQSMNRVYKWMLPVWQVVRYKSPVVWAGMAVSNIAARTLQPAVIDIIARRAIDLYSGRLAAGATTVIAAKAMSAADGD
ncbi:MAG: hypothetical protein K1X78_11400 [Verrucomicrobiaceae bacterium]|nr:hypothetical protein [Verrucomicrobiaceae bacterium]